MAFSPDYETSGLFYVFWVANGSDALDPDGVVGDIRIVEFQRSETDPDLADPASARLVLKHPHSAGNHNGGWMGFGPDGHLYFTIGDNAAPGNAQSVLNLFGKVIRIIRPIRMVRPPDRNHPGRQPLRLGCRGQG